MNEEQANAVYNILIQHAGANDDEDSRRQFVYHVTNGCREYRFMGWLGSGGKFYVEPDGWRVDCYLEDMTPGRQSIVVFTNAALADLYVRERAA